MSPSRPRSWPRSCVSSSDALGASNGPLPSCSARFLFVRFIEELPVHPHQELEARAVHELGSCDAASSSRSEGFSFLEGEDSSFFSF